MKRIVIFVIYEHIKALVFAIDRTYWKKWNLACIYIYIYIYICIYYIIVLRLAYFHRKHVFPRKLIICFENMILSFESMKVSKKVNCMLRKYDSFVQENTNMTPIHKKGHIENSNKQIYLLSCIEKLLKRIVFNHI